MKLIDLEERKDKVCFFCNADKSVKYEAHLKSEEPNAPVIHVCNKCVAIHSEEIF